MAALGCLQSPDCLIDLSLTPERSAPAGTGLLIVFSRPQAVGIRLLESANRPQRANEGKVDRTVTGIYRHGLKQLGDRFLLSAERQKQKYGEVL